MVEGELAGKVAIITGAGRLRGIGRATAVSLARLGCDVTVTGTGRDPSTFPPDEKEVGWRDIESTADQVRDLGRRALTVVADVSRSEDCRRIVDETMRAFGQVDILINNAAYPRAEDRVAVVDLDEDVLRRVLDIKVVGAFLLCKFVGRILIDQGQGGRIVNVSSIASKKSEANTSAYAAANAAIEGLTRSLARELAPHNVTVNAVCPGTIDTARMDVLGRGEDWERRIHRRIPLDRAATDEEVGEYIAFLCTKTASYITGQALNFDGGIVMER
ncbi:MAG TPA: SDR family NAD(P)-dependent oxidoreductase [Dehalococcoidia bacterium]|nr:SDR family NAD(P)-dependent oxidoreductase [Dehalococcoidia bacterium]